jgi:hypothetical protein
VKAPIFLRKAPGESGAEISKVVRFDHIPRSTISALATIFLSLTPFEMR